MANFITCWLQDPGDLPPGDGPPGGSGDGGPKDDDDDGEDCTGFITYYGCVTPDTLDWDNETNCTFSFDEPIDCENGNAECVADPGGAGLACSSMGDPRCEVTCEGPKVSCAGSKCLGLPTGSCDPWPLGTDYDLYRAGMCGKTKAPGCGDIQWPCDGSYIDNAACMAADAPPAGPGNCVAATCPSFICETVGCEPGGGQEKGECKGSSVTFADCPNFFDADEVTCYDNPANPQSCDVNGILHYQKESDCEDADECIKVLTCPAFECDPESEECDYTGTGGSTGGEECCSAVTLSNADGDYCDAGGDPPNCNVEGVYNGTGPYYIDKPTCEADCIKCGNGYLCKNEDGEDTEFYGDCEQDPPACPLVWDSDDESCELEEGYEDSCFKLQPDCLESGCECSGFVGCELALATDNTSTDCRTCDPSGLEQGTGGFGKCLYDDETKVFALNGYPTLTCQEFYDAYKASDYYFPIASEDDKADTEALCESACTDDTPPPCHSCTKETNCYECEEIMEPLRMEVCVESNETVNKCQEDDGCTATKDLAGDWECVCSPGTYYIDPDCDDKCYNCHEHPDGDLYDSNDCDNECGLTGGGGPPPPEEGYGFYGGKKAYERIYASDKGNPIFEKHISNIKVKNTPGFVPVLRGDLREDLFKHRIHVGIKATTDINNKTIRFSDNPFSDLSDKNIEKSIHNHIILKLNLARAATGKPLKKMFLSTIRGLIISNRLDTFNLQQLNELLDRIISVQDAPEYKDTRKYTPLLNLNTIGNEAAAIELATKHIWPLNPDSYSEVRVSERMRTWKTLAPDLQKYLPITTTEGVTTPFYYSISDTITLAGSGTLTLSNGDLQHITLSDGSTGAIPIQSLRDRAGILSIETLQKLMYLLGDEYDFNLKATTDQIDRVDERYGLTNARKNIYFLALQPDTITDLERRNPFVARSKATYKWEHTAEAKNSTVSTAGSGAAFPCLEVYLDVNDPFFSYIENKGILELTFKDFVLDLFDEEDTQNLFIPVIPRRVPQVIAIYPSDMTSTVVTNNISKSTSYGVREVDIVMNPNPDRIDTWHPVFLQEELAYPARGIDPSKDNYQSLKYSMNTQDIKDQSLFYSGEQPTERIAWGERQVYKIAQELKADYQLPANNTINWYEIYDRMDIPQMKFLHKECRNFESFKSLLSMGNPSSSKVVNAHYPKIKEYRSRNWLAGGDPTESVYDDIKWLEVKPNHTPIPPTPLD